MPCRDAGEHLGAAIASVSAQSFEDYEVVAVDDGSSDDTFAQLYAWARRDGRVRVLNGHGRGLVAALSTGLAAARGTYVARMDADDVADPERFRKQVSLMDAQPHVAACGSLVEYFPAESVQDGARRYEAWLNSLVEPDDIVRDIFVECPLAHPTLMIRRRMLLSVGGYRNMGWPEDYDLVLRLWAAGYGLVKVPEVLLRWREGPERLSRSDARYSPEAFRRAKVYFLTRTLLLVRRGAVVWGAGPVGKEFARELQRQDVAVTAFVDLDPRKIGQEIHGAPVIAPDDVDRYRASLALAAVGQNGAREEIRAELRRRGWTEMHDFCAVA
jgi:glycosyltransferase involved in cell wall biosynthesis